MESLDLRCRFTAEYLLMSYITNN